MGTITNIKTQPKKKKPSPSASTSVAAAALKSKGSPNKAERERRAEQQRLDLLHNAVAPEGKLPLPQKLVRWRTLSVEWRAILERNVKAAQWRAENLTPNTLHASPLANADGSLTLFEGKTASGQVRLFYSVGQIKAAWSAMLERGVSYPWLKANWDTEWEWPAEQIKELKRVRFTDTAALRQRLAGLKSAREALRAPQQQRKGQDTLAEPTTTTAAPSEAGAPSASAAYRKRLVSATSLPTPSPSVESSPEPSSAASSEPKRPKPTLTPAQEAAKLAREQASLVKWNEELDLTRGTWMRAKKEGGAAFLSLDVEMWEYSASCLTEFGWSVTEFIKEDDGSVTERRDDQHIIIKEHLSRRNGRWSPDAREHFDFGTSVQLSLSATFNLLYATLETLSANQPLFLIFHDPRADLRALHILGFEHEFFAKSVATAAASKQGVPREGLLVCDTQALYSAWAGVPYQKGLGKCCEVLEVPTKRLHNAGNDARYTQILFERMMDPSIPRPTPLVPLPKATA